MKRSIKSISITNQNTPINFTKQFKSGVISGAIPDDNLKCISPYKLHTFTWRRSVRCSRMHVLVWHLIEMT